MVKRMFGWIGLWLLASFLWCIPVGIFGSSNLVWFGHGPQIPGTSVPIIGLVLGTITTLVIWLVRRRRATPAPRRNDDAQWDGAPEGSESFLNDRDRFSDDRDGNSELDTVGALERLATLHERGALTDAGFEVGKHKLIEHG